MRSWMAASFFLTSPSLQAGNSPQMAAALESVAAAYMELQPIPEGFRLSHIQAKRVQDQLVTGLVPGLGSVVGYKAGLTNKKGQQQFAIKHPILGTLMENMFTSTGSTLARTQGVRLMAEADLMVRVSDSAINEATTHEQVLAALKEVIPVIEVPDLMFEPDVKPNGKSFEAANVGARFFVLGAAIPLNNDRQWIDRLQNFSVELIDGNGASVATGNGSELLEHPLNVVLWIRDELKRQGKSLVPDTLLSLGSLTQLIPIDKLDRLDAVYRGLTPDQDLRVVVGFRDQ